MDNGKYNASEMDNSRFSTTRGAVRFIKAHITPYVGPKDTNFELLLCSLPKFHFHTYLTQFSTQVSFCT